MRTRQARAIADTDRVVSYALVRFLHLGLYADASKRGNASWAAIAGFAVTVALGLLITVGMWWTYFEGFAGKAEERLREHDDPVLAAADGYSYLHLVIVAGIITFAVGVKVLTRDSVSAPLPDPARFALCGGVAMYLVGHAAFALRMVDEVEYEKLAVALALLGLFAVAGGLAAWALAVAIAALVGALCVFESESVRRAVSKGRREASAVG